LSLEGGRRTVDGLMLAVVLLALVCVATRFRGAVLPDEPGLAWLGCCLVRVVEGGYLEVSRFVVS
jgi:hypothetical protein